MEPDWANLANILYTTSKPEEQVKRCVVVMDKHRAITYRHGTVHGNFTLGQETQIYPARSRTQGSIRVKVVAISDPADFVIFEIMEKEFDVYPKRLAPALYGMGYRMLGIDSNGDPSAKGGVIGKARIHYVVGDNHADVGDSGAAIINLAGDFIGMAIGKKDYVSMSEQMQELDVKLAHAASHFSYAKIVPIQTISAFLPLGDEDDEPSSKREKHEE